MPKRSAALMLYRSFSDRIEVLLVHPGGPYWAKKDAGAWSLPKGEYADGEDPQLAAIREFAEELGSPPPDGDLRPLGTLRQAGGKLVTAWAIEGDFDVSTFHSNAFEMEWPPRSGERVEFPEVDRSQWFSVDEARSKLNAGQVSLLDALLNALEERPSGAQG